MQVSGTSGVCIVSGYPGSGKTCLVREALERMKQEGALVASAKFDQYSEDVPYTAIVQPFRLLLMIGTTHFRHCPATVLQ